MNGIGYNTWLILELRKRVAAFDADMPGVSVSSFIIRSSSSGPTPTRQFLTYA